MFPGTRRPAFEPSRHRVDLLAMIVDLRGLPEVAEVQLQPLLLHLLNALAVQRRLLSVVLRARRVDTAVDA